MRDLNAEMRDVLEKCCEKIIAAIRGAIRGNLFSKAGWGAPLAESTKAKRRKSGKINSYKPLLWYGEFSGGLTARAIHEKNEWAVYSTGRTEEQQAMFLEGTATIPRRQVFRKDLPASRGQTIEQDCVAYAATKLFQNAKAQIQDVIRRHNTKAK